MVMHCSSQQSLSPSLAARLPSECLVIDRLYIGDVKLALRVLLADDHLGVTHMLSLVSSFILSSKCSDLPDVASLKKEDLTAVHFEAAENGSSLLRMVVPLLDSPEEDILQVMQACFELIDLGRRQGIVLVHCVSGKSRSAAVVAAYLMWSKGFSLQQAMDTVNRTYKKASPNSGYLRQLKCLESQLCKSPKGRTDACKLPNGLAVDDDHQKTLAIAQ